MDYSIELLKSELVELINKNLQTVGPTVIAYVLQDVHSELVKLIPTAIKQTTPEEAQEVQQAIADELEEAEEQTE